MSPEHTPTPRFVHYSYETEVVLHEWHGPGYMKPAGLWFGVEGIEDDFSWKDWCESESWGLGPYPHEVILEPEANMLWLRTAEHLDDFTRRYGVVAHPEVSLLLDYRTIDWHKVATQAVDQPGGYDGLIIAPYIWSRRLHNGTHWYYGWDCSSGVIWNAAAIKAIRPLQLQEVAP